MDEAPLVIQIKGFDKVMGVLKNLADRSPGEFGQALKEEMDDAMMESNGEVPFDHLNPHLDGTPHLRDTGKVVGPLYESDKIKVILSYEGAPYAAIVHENPLVRHHWPTKWKYLEDPVNRRVPNIGPALMARIDAILSGTVGPMPFTPQELIEHDYNAWATGTIGGMNTGKSWGRQWNTGNLYPLQEVEK